MSKRSAFTLVEVTVAIAVTLVLMTLMLQVLNQSSIIWNRSNESLDTFREARGALELMARELGQIRSMPVPERTFPLLSLRHSPQTQPEDTMNQEIYGLVRARNEDKADLCAVGYYCKWVESRSAFSLVRQFSPSGETFSNLRLVLSASSPLNNSQAFTQLYSRNREEAVATYLWDLQFALPDNINFSETDLQRQTWPQGDFSQKLPPWVEVRCKSLGSLAARRLKGIGLTRDVWANPEAPLYKKLIAPHQQQFVTRISFAQ